MASASAPLSAPASTLSSAPGPAPGEVDLLRLVQWLSPAFPVGGYAYSHGLETAIAGGGVRCAASFSAWLAPVVLRGAGWCDAVLLSLAHRDSVPLAELDDLAMALCAGAERAAETRALGAAFARVADGIGACAPGGETACALPVAVGLRARALDLPTARVAGLYVQAFAGNLATIAARAVPLGATAAQAALADLGPGIAALAARAATAGTDALVASVPGADLASLAHETAPARLFSS